MALNTPDITTYTCTAQETWHCTDLHHKSRRVSLHVIITADSRENLIGYSK